MPPAGFKRVITHFFIILLVGVDEVGTIEALKAHRQALIEPLVADHNGRTFKTTGDGFLVEFSSVVDAITCAIAIQQRMTRRNSKIPIKKQIVFRIGINVGDIVVDRDDILGDGVNIAARLQALCAPGGLCISRAANDQIRDTLHIAFRDLGQQVVKNIARPLDVFGLGPDEIASLPVEKFTAPGRTAGGAKRLRSGNRVADQGGILQGVGWSTDRLCDRRERTTSCQSAELDDPFGV